MNRSESEVRSEIRSGLPRTYEDKTTDERTERDCHLRDETFSSVTRTRTYGFPFIDVEIERWLQMRRGWNLRAIRRDARQIAARIVEAMDLAALESLEQRLEAEGYASLTAYVNAAIDRLGTLRKVSVVGGGLPTLGKGHR